MLYAKSRNNETMPTRLGEHAFTRINQHHCHIGSGCAGGHIACVLLVAWAIGHNEFAFFGCKKTIRHIDGNALLALGGKAINQQREIHGFALRAVLGAVLL